MSSNPPIPSKSEFEYCLKEYLPFLREMSGWSIEQVVELSECPLDFYQGYERGIVPDWDLAANHVLGLALVFDVPSAMLLAMPPFGNMDSISKAIARLQGECGLNKADSEYFAGLPFREQLWAVYYMLTGSDKSRGYTDITDLINGIRNNRGMVPSRKWGQPRLMEALGDIDRYPDDEPETYQGPAQHKPS